MKSSVISPVSRNSMIIDVFAVDSNSNMEYKDYLNNHWAPSDSAWENLGGIFSSAPAAVSRTKDVIDVFAVAPDSQMYYRDYIAGNWNPRDRWTILSGKTFSTQPAAVSRIDQIMTVFAVGTDSQMYYNDWRLDNNNKYNWSGWTLIPAPPGIFFSSAPAAVSRGPGMMTVFAVTSDNHMYYNDWEGIGFGTWTQIGGEQTFSSAPAAVSRDNDIMNIFALGTDGLMHYFDYINHNYTLAPNAWGNNIVFSSAPAAVSRGPGMMTVFAVAANSRMFYNDYITGNFGEGDWHGWNQMSSPILFSSAPAAVSRAHNYMNVFVLGTDSQMYYAEWNNISESLDPFQWKPMGGTLRNH